MKKNCNKCKSLLDLSKFRKYQGKRHGKEYIRNVCSSCISERNTRRNGLNKRILRNQAIVREHKIIAFVREVKTDPNNKPFSFPCSICQAVFPLYATQFDHINPKLKSINISSIHSTHWGFPKICGEIRKCRIVCVFCHRKISNSYSKILAKNFRKNDSVGYDNFVEGTKFCKKCSKYKEFSDFKNDGHNYSCSDCERKRQRGKRKIAFDFIDSLKNSTPCVNCEEQYCAEFMDFDHLPKYQKEIGISEACSKGWSIDKLKEEVLKCQILCAACHIQITNSRLDHKRNIKPHTFSSSERKLIEECHLLMAS